MTPETIEKSIKEILEKYPSIIWTFSFFGAGSIITGLFFWACKTIKSKIFKRARINICPKLERYANLNPLSPDYRLTLSIKNIARESFYLEKIIVDDFKLDTVDLLRTNLKQENGKLVYQQFVTIESFHKSGPNLQIHLNSSENVPNKFKTTIIGRDKNGMNKIIKKVIKRPDISEKVICNYCGKRIDKVLLICPYCRKELNSNL